MQAWQLENGGGSPFCLLDSAGATQLVLDLIPFTPLPTELAGLEVEFEAHVLALVGTPLRSSAPVRLRFR